MKTYLHGPTDYAREKYETAISCRGPEPTRKKRYSYTSSGEEEDVAINICPCGTTTESTHVVEECGICKEERDALEEEMMTFDVPGM